MTNKNALLSHDGVIAHTCAKTNLSIAVIVAPVSQHRMHLHVMQIDFDIALPTRLAHLNFQGCYSYLRRAAAPAPQFDSSEIRTDILIVFAHQRRKAHANAYNSYPRYNRDILSRKRNGLCNDAIPSHSTLVI